VKIGVMLRHYEQHGGGLKLYTHRLAQEFAAMDTRMISFSCIRILGSFLRTRLLATAT
jgi:hypothetical protein